MSGPFGFPAALVRWLRCTVDGAELKVAAGAATTGEGAILRADLACSHCGAKYPIDGGILDLMGTASLDEESRHEQARRDSDEQALHDEQSNRPDTEHNRMEMTPVFEALALEPGMALLELGCGDGRYTVGLSARCRDVLAVDFSRGSLQRLQEHAPHLRNVGLCQGDVTSLKVAGGFDRVLSTLTSNLPTRGHRDALYRLAAAALAPDGRFVHAVHHHALRDRLRQAPKSGRYHEGGIYRYAMTVRECEAETRAYFTRVAARPIQIYLPFARRLGLPLLAQSRFAERMPLLNRLGEILVCVASGPAERKD